MRVTHNVVDPPVVLVFAGHDPTGGAGVQADIEALLSQGCHAVTVITALTVQDTRGVYRFQEVDPRMVEKQSEAVLADMPVAAIKIGMVGTVKMARSIGGLLERHPAIPVVLDPVLRGGEGGALSEADVSNSLRDLLLPLTTLATPNTPEARRLVPGGATLEACADGILRTGCRAVLITGTHEEGDDVTHTLYQQEGAIRRYRCARLPGRYHGSGCTLSAAIAGRIARGEPLPAAIDKAQRYTWNALRHARRLGRGQQLPDRLFWRRGEEESRG